MRGHLISLPTKLLVELSPDKQNKLVSLAILMGFRREQPKKSWTEKEHKEAMRYAIDVLISMADSHAV